MTKRGKLPKMGGKLAKFAAPKTATESDVDQAPNMTAEPTTTSGTKKKLTVSLNDAAWFQLRMLALEQRTSGQKLLVDAVNLLFEKYAKKPLA